MSTITFLDPSLSIEDIEKIMTTPRYPGVSKLRQHAYVSKTYKGKNENGGIKCSMSTPASYKNRPLPCCIPWGTLREGTINYVPAPNNV